MTGRRRRELAESFHLVASDEQWFTRDLLVGAVAFALWIAGSGVLTVQAASALDRSLGLAAGEPPTLLAIATFAVLWLVVPALAVTVRMRRRTLNLRGNVEQYYRLDRPAALLAPPALLVLVTGAAAVALGSFPWYVALVMVPVGLFVLVRTLAFSYRVYSFSHPRVVQALALLSTAVLLGTVLVAVAIATGSRTLVEQAFRAVGLPTWITGTVAVEGVAVSGLAAVALFPVLVALGYVLAQTVVALGIRLTKPEVDRSRMRTGQRYPPFLPAATPAQPSGEPTATDDGVPDVDCDVATDDGTATDSGAADVTGDADVGESGVPDDEGDDLDDVSNTRVFTPPADGSGFDAGVETDAGSTTSAGTADDPAGETRAVPSDGDDGSSADRREHCDACGESFSVDTPVRFCPNCGGAL